MKLTVLQISKSLFYFILFIMLGTASLYGVILPKAMPVKPVASLQLTPFEDGLSLHQGDKKYYYTFSPFNDYYISPDGSRSTFITQEELEEEKYLSDWHSSHAKDIIVALKSYLNITKPQIHFWGPSSDISYATDFNENQIKINRKLRLNLPFQPVTLGSTMKYYGGDFIYDDKGIYYTYQSGQDLTFYYQLYGVRLIEISDLSQKTIAGRVVYISNPDLLGIIKITAGPRQNLFINRSARLIEIEEEATPTKDNSYETSIAIEIIKNQNMAKYHL